jgi:microcystin degradation protein MlrC
MAVSAGLGATVDVEIGAHVDAGPHGAVAVTAQIVGLSSDAGGDVAALRAGGLTFIVTSRRRQFGTIEAWTAVNADPRGADVAVVKLGYLEPELYDVAADWRLALTPGGVDQDLVRLERHGLRRPLFPFDPAMDTPDLTAELL